MLVGRSPLGQIGCPFRTSMILEHGKYASGSSEGFTAVPEVVAASISLSLLRRFVRQGKNYTRTGDHSRLNEQGMKEFRSRRISAKKRSHAKEIGKKSQTEDGPQLQRQPQH